MRALLLAALATALLPSPAMPFSPATTLVQQSVSELDDNATKALQSSERALREDPNVVGGQRARGAALSALARYNDAAEAFRLAVAQNPADGQSIVGLARAHRRMKMPEQALALLNKLLSADPKNMPALFERALVFSALDRPENALNDYNQLIALEASASTLFNRGWILADRKELVKAIADFERALVLDPKDIDTNNALGWAFLEAERYEESLAKYSASLRLSKDNSEALIGIADANYNLKRWPAAALAYRTAQKSDPKRATLSVMEARSLEKAGDTKGAYAAYDAALRIDPTLSDALERRAALYKANGDLKSALADFDKAIAISPKNVDNFVSRALIYRTSDRRDAALADLKRALELEPKSSYALNALGLLRRDSKEYDQAITAFDAAIASDPSMEPAFYNRGNVYFNLKRYDRAIRDYNASLKLSPGDPLTLSAKGEAYRMMSDDIRAIEELSEAIKQDPNMAQAYLRRAEAYEALGDAGASKADRSTALKLDPDAEL